MEKLRKLELFGCVFKRCTTRKYDYLVALRKPTENFKCNELRTSVIDKNFAKFRCNGLITVAIYDMLCNKFIDHFVHETFTPYSVGNLTLPNWYNPDITAICTNGIHYFLTLNAALLYMHGAVEGYNCEGKHIY